MSTGLCVAEPFEIIMNFMLRKFVPLVAINSVVVMTVAFIAITKPSFIRAGALLIVLLFIFNVFYIRNLQRKQAQAVAAGRAKPVSPAARRALMWFLAVYGVISYISAAFNVPDLVAQHDVGPWLGWSVKLGFGSLCVWLAYRIRGLLKAVPSSAVQRDNHAGV
jgi:hypothetical protein